MKRKAMAIFGLGHLISTLTKYLPQRRPDEVVPRNLEFGKMLSDAQSQGHAGVTLRPTGEHNAWWEGHVHRQRPGAKQDSSLFPPKSLNSGTE